MKIKQLLKDNKAQMGGGGSMDLPSVMIVLVIAAIVGFVGLQVMSTVIETTGLQGDQNETKAGCQDCDPLYNASVDLQDAVNQAWGLIAVAFIVVILSVIITYLYGLRGAR